MRLLESNVLKVAKVTIILGGNAPLNEVSLLFLFSPHAIYSFRQNIVLCSILKYPKSFEKTIL